MADKYERIQLIRAMERVALATNNEDFIWEIWRLDGVPDGYITDSSLDYEIEWLTEDKYFAAIMDAFLALMMHARLDGGLYFDGVLNAPLPDDEVEPVESEDISTLI